MLILSGSRCANNWRTVKRSLRFWPSLWVKGSVLETRALNDSRLAKMEELYGPLPVGKKVVEEAGGDGLTKEEVVQKRPLPNPYLGIGNLNFLSYSSN